MLPLNLDAAVATPFGKTQTHGATATAHATTAAVSSLRLLPRVFAAGEWLAATESHIEDGFHPTRQHP